MLGKISVIVPIYNLERYIERTIDSIINQTYRNLEIILVNDGSSDNSLLKMEEIKKKDSRIIIIDKKNGGVTSARLAGVSISTGQYVGFIDGDDYIEPSMFQRLVDNMINYNADISHCGYQMIFSDGRKNYFHGTNTIHIQNKQKGLEDLLTGRMVEPGLCNKLFKRELLIKVLNSRVIDKSIKINEDLLMNYYLFFESNLSVFEDVCLYHYIVRNNSASREKLNRNQIYDPIKVKEIIYNDAPEEMKLFCKNALLYTMIYSYCNLTLCSRKEFMPEKKDIRKRLRLQNRGFIYLSLKAKLLAYWIVLEPHTFRIVYRLYSKYFQANPYK